MTKHKNFSGIVSEPGKDLKCRKKAIAAETT